MAEEQLTPMMAQFRSLKAAHPDALLLFRCGDFYETYCEDAVLASQILGITLTRRNNKGKGKEVEMAGFPHHALDSYLPKLVRAGHRVAICDQLEDPKLAKKLVKRGITEVVTPGVALTDNILNSKENNYVAAVAFGRSSCGLSLLDISTGEFAVAEGTMDYIGKLCTSFSPKEILVSRVNRERFNALFGNRFYVFAMDDWAFNEKSAQERLCKHFKVKTMKGYGIAHLTAGMTAAGAVLFYLDDTQHTHLQHITSIQRIEEDGYVRMDDFTLRNLEILSPLALGGRSLLSVMDRTLTPMGARLLHKWISFPLYHVKAIETRLNCVEYFFREPDFRQIIEDNLHSIGDMERLVAKLSSSRISPREMQQLRMDLEAVAPVLQACGEASLSSMRDLGSRMDDCSDLRKHIADCLLPDPPALTNKGGYIANGINKELDELRYLSSSSKEYLLEIQRRETERTGISSLKIGFNNVFGYYLEVRNTFKDKVPPEWIRKQTLAQAERYITQELKDYETKILGAEDRMLVLEAQIYAELLEAAKAYIPVMQKTSIALSQLDCLLGFATLARERHYVRPIIDDSCVLDIREGRHPVIETEMPAGESYIPNDVYLDNEKQQIVIVTGPNMAGKSALLRQTALIVIMAQTGCFVPASSARVGLVDKVFTRVGASDNISAGESTFMVEMSEAASIMNNISSRSLVLFDELGRGTSTYDGISIAWAIVEYLHENKGRNPRTLFATHYHELNEMEKRFSRIHNFNVSVKEVDNHVVFLRKLAPGGSEHSFGIHVAQMAGMPVSIVKRANQILKDLETSNQGKEVGKSIPSSAKEEGVQLNFFQMDDPVLCQVRDTILGLDINALTPLEALNTLNSIKKIIDAK